MAQAFRSGLCAGIVAACVGLAACGSDNSGSPAARSSDTPQVGASAAPTTAEAAALAKSNLGFEQTDLDGDGRVSKAEYAARSSGFFTSMDHDDDGGLTVAELDRARSLMQIVGGPSSEKLISSADNDGDEKLTLAEFVGDVNKRFVAADSDADGILTSAEYKAGHPELAEPPASAAAATAAP